MTGACRRTIGAAAALLAGSVLLATSPARAQSITSLSAAKNAGNNPDNFQDGLTASFQRTTTVGVLSNTGLVARVRYQEVVGTDTGIFTSQSNTQASDYSINFDVTAPGAYDLNITTSLNGAFTLVDDGTGSATADVTAVAGTLSGGTLFSGTTSLTDPGTLSGGGGGNTAISRTSSAVVQGTSNGAAQAHSLRFTWSASCSSSSSVTGGDECAVRLGIPISYTGETAGDYPGAGSRTAANDGHFVTIALVSLCGDGVVQGTRGEQCDLGGGLNGAPGTCCTSSCQLRPNGFACRASGGVCDVAESCNGVSGTCPADAKQPNGTVCNAGSGDLCDPNETCNGITNTCPSDTVSPNGTVCRPGSGDLCDPAETCTGVADQPCPANVISPNGTLCNAGSGDLCDPDEHCTGVAGQACPTDAIAPGGTTCRTGSGDLCDPDEACTGVADQPCPADSVSGAFVLCRAGSGDSCDPSENCTGTPGQPCPPNVVTPGGTVCNPGSGDLCDPDEHCTGVAGQTCPTDTVSSGSTVCRAGSGDLCDPSEHCPGIADQACPPNTITPGGTVCRPGSGDLCDPSESCTGVAGQACPANTVSSGSTVCRTGSGDLCDPDEHCTGSAGQPCPADSVSGAFVACRPSAGDCDVAENCTGTAGQACPPDAKSTAVCRGAAGDCDVAESCDGVNNACPTDAFAPSSTVCRASTGTCDIAESCTGTSAACPADTGLPDTDSDTVCDAIDNCVSIANASQTNGDADALGDACDPCTNIVPTGQDKVKLTLTKLLAPAGDDKVSFKGFFTNVPASPTIDPLTNGMRFLLVDSTGAIPVDVTIPGGAYNTANKVGWKVNGSGTSWTYKNAGSVVPLINGIQKMQLKKMSSPPGKYKFGVKGKNGNYAVNPANLPLVGTIVIDVPFAETGQCGEAMFPATPPAKPSCLSVSAGKTIKCK